MPHHSNVILKHLPTGVPLKGAEIGVNHGYNADRLLRMRRFLHLTLVDPWEVPTGHFKATGDFYDKTNQQDWEITFFETMQRLYYARNRLRVIRRPSIEASTFVPDETLDFVFIDGDHSYEGCKIDIAAWWPKVKLGGWLGGHDYGERWGWDKGNKYGPNRPYGVKQAVDEFVSLQGSDNLILDDARCWFYYKR